MSEATGLTPSRKADHFEAAEWALYACPDTHAPLVREQDELVSGDGTRSYRIRDGLPCFLRYEPVEDGQTVARLDRLNDLARERGWLTALNEVFPEYVRYATDTSRLSFIRLLPFTTDSRVLEIGASLGQHTFHLSERAKAVHALEVVPGQATFILQRCRQQGAGTVFAACGGDDCSLPYRHASFDVAVINLVFEWCATRETGPDPEAGQLRLLYEVERVLRPGGTVFLATKNRYALRLLLGRPDGHAYGMRFGHALPRWLMRVLLRPVRQGEARGLLHSYAGLRRLLLGAGFGVIRSFWAAPDMRYPERYIEADVASIRAARRAGGFRQGEGRIDRLIRFLPARMVKHVAPGLVFIARKPH